MNQRELFRVDGLPVFQNKIFSNRTKAIDCSRGDIRLIQDMDTGLIFNAAFDASLLEYDEDYQNEQAYSNVFKQHLQTVREIFQRFFFGKRLIEVGCGKGYFLEYLNQAGFEIIGIDPAYEGDNPNCVRACFDKDLGLSGEGIILRHVLEHIPNPFNFLSDIAIANGGGGKVYIEVPCFDWICDNSVWFDIYYEHVNYFRLNDFHRMFGTVFESGHIFGGQYLYIVADLTTLKKPVMKKSDTFLFPENFLSNIDRLATLAKGKKNSVWGGASKGVIFTIYMQRAGVNIDTIIDINPAKQGRFIAISGLKVSSPEDGLKTLLPNDDIFVMNSNYLNEIIDLSDNQFNYIKVD
ncbi:MAG: class I SAM-dependent methyltransferase [Porticoccaceae bacterium]